MVTIILAIALLVALMALGVEIGIASWNIRRASRYLYREAAAEHTAERAVEARQDMAKRLEFLNGYASKISWLLNFLYNRYDKFADLEKEVQEGLKGVTGNTSIGEADAKYKELKRALKIIRITVKVVARMEDLANSINTQISQILEDFRDEEEDERKSESPEPDKPAKGKAEESPEPKAPEFSPEDEVLSF
jgi:chemotaxis regulatin CheY-phosphate phosphatase CheZ